MEKELTIKLTEVEAKSIMVALSHFPHREVAELISKIEKQLTK